MENSAKRTIPGLHQNRWFPGNPARFKIKGQHIISRNLADIDLAAIRFHVTVTIGNDVEFATRVIARLMRALAQPTRRRIAIRHHRVACIGKHVAAPVFRK